MRLLQLVTGHDELIDLHPNVTVVTGLGVEGRRLLSAAVNGLARGEANGARGLLEAHGVLFDLTSEMLALLQMAGVDLRPVVTRDDLPTARFDPEARQRVAAERARSEAEERWTTAAAADGQALRSVAAATQALERARQAMEVADSDAAGRIGSVDGLTAELDQAVEQRRRLAEARAELDVLVGRASTERAEVEATTAKLRDARRHAAARGSLLAAEVDQAASGSDPDAVGAAEEAAAALAAVEAEVAAERDAERRAERERPEVLAEEPPAEHLDRVQRAIDDLEKRLAAFGPIELHDVREELERAGSVDLDEMVPSPRALTLADELVALEAELAATSEPSGPPGGLAVGRARLDDARQALLEAEQSVRNPELDRATVERLETAHADLVEAIEKADGRFGVAKAQRRVETGRAAEQAALDELGFTSYSDYMMGYSVVHADPDKQAALDVARSELSAAEDGWHALQAETDAGLARAELMERRRRLVEEARALLPGPVPAGSLIDELCELRVPAMASTTATDGLRRALETAGLAVGDEDLDHGDLLLVAEAWLEEAAEAVEREAQVRHDLQVLRDERDVARADLEAAEARAALPEPVSPELARVARVDEASRTARLADERRLAHEEAERTADSLTHELAAAAEAERRTALAAGAAEAACSDAVSHADGLIDQLRRLDDQLAQAVQDEVASEERLRSWSDADGTPPLEVLAEAVDEAEAVVRAAEAAAEVATQVLQAATVQRQEAVTASEALPRAPGAIDDDLSVAEDVEWYLLARLAAQRSASLAGSLPLVLDEALGGLGEDDLGHVLGRLERMAEAVQVIVVSDDPRSHAWALLAGPDRAAVVSPQPV